MFAHLMEWLNKNNENKLIALLVATTLGALLNKLIPLFLDLIGKLATSIGRHFGGRIGFRYYQHLYLNWLVTELRELKLTGVVSSEPMKKPKLEQVFISLRVGEERDKLSAREATQAVIEDMSRRRVVDYALVTSLLRELALASPADRREAERALALYISRHSSRLKRLLRYFGRRDKSEAPIVPEQVLAELYARPHVRPEAGDYPALLLRKILRHEKQIAILGAPGAGKSTLLQYIGLAYARSRAGDPKLRQRKAYRSRLGSSRWRVPIFVPLGSIAKKLLDPLPDGREPSLVDVIPSMLPPDLQGGNAQKYFSRQLEKGNCVVLLDGLDEVPTEREFQAVVRAIEGLSVTAHQNQFIISSRISGWRSGVKAEFKCYYVNDLTDDQVSSFIDTWYSAVETNSVVGDLKNEGQTDRRNRQRRAAKQAADLKAALKENGGLRQLATNPMLLSIIALVHHSLASLPEERGKLYSECSKILLEQWDTIKGLRLDDTQLKLDQKDVIIRRVAFGLHTGEIGKPGGGREATRAEVERLLAEILPDFGQQASEASHLLTILVERSGIIVERRRDILAFAHLTFQEYFAARHLAKEERPESREFLLHTDRLLSTWWREVVLLYSGMLGDSSTFVSSVWSAKDDDVGQSTLRLAAGCLGEAIQVKQGSVRNLISKELIRVRTKGQILAVTGEVPSDLVSYLVRWSKEDTWMSHALVCSMVTRADLSTAVTGRVLSMLKSDLAPMQRAALDVMRLLPKSHFSIEMISEIIGLLKRSDTDISVLALGVLGALWHDDLDIDTGPTFQYILERRQSRVVAELKRHRESRVIRF